MELPFSAAQFFDVFAHYNAGIWPAQFVLLFLGFIIAVLLLVNVRSSPVMLPILAFLWLWMGLVYFAAFFVTINPAARILAIVFLLEALLLIWNSVTTLTPAAPSRAQRVAAVSLFTYAMLVYPLLDYAAGHRYPASITFGLPCPTVIFTFGVFCLLAETTPAVLYVIPVLWALAGSVAAVRLGVPQDLGLPVAAAVALLFALPRHPAVRWREAT